MRKYIYTGLFFALCTFQTINAQDSEGSTALNFKGYTSLSYSIGVPVGNLYNYISTSSFRGATLGYSRFVSPSVSLGLNVSWNVFYQEVPDGTYTYGTASLSGKQYRYSNNAPIIFNANYFFMPNEKLNPYAGLGIGTIYTLRNTDMNLYTLEQEVWNFALQPEIGVNYEIHPRTALTFAVKYYHGFQSGDIKDNQTYLGINLGFTFFHR